MVSMMTIGSGVPVEPRLAAGSIPVVVAAFPVDGPNPVVAEAFPVAVPTLVVVAASPVAGWAHRPA
jgi:hypothetical protein